MKRNPRTYKLSATVLLLIISVTLSFPSLAADKMKPEEVVAKHLDSIGTAEARTAVKNRIVAGLVNTTLRSPATAQFDGTFVMASEGSKNIIGMGFENANYSQEKFGFDGQNVLVAYARPGARSNLGDFLYTYKDILKYGLIGGALSDSWPLLNLSAKQQKLEYVGLKKIGDKQVHQLRYMPHGSSDVDISLYFDADTFQHVRTEYSRFISAGIGRNMDSSGQQRSTHYKMVEEFSDFKKEGGLMLPHSYKISLDLDTGGGTFSGTWDVTLNQFSFNQAIPPATFGPSAKS